MNETRQPLLAAITYHFGSKDGLVADALLEELRSWLTPTLDVRVAGSPSPTVWCCT